MIRGVGQLGERRFCFIGCPFKPSFHSLRVSKVRSVVSVAAASIFDSAMQPKFFVAERVYAWGIHTVRYSCECFYQAAQRIKIALAD